MNAPLPLLRVADVARLTGYSEDVILRDIRAGLLPALRRPRGAAFLIQQEAYAQYLKRLEYTPAGSSGKGRHKATDAFRRHLRAIAGGRVR